MSLKICSKAFFSNYIINPFSNELTKQEKAGAFCASFFLGLITLGICQLVAFIALKNKKVTVEKKTDQTQQKPATVFKERVKNKAEETAKAEEEKKTVARENKKEQLPQENKREETQKKSDAKQLAIAETIQKAKEKDKLLPELGGHPYSYHVAKALEGDKTSQAYYGIYEINHGNEAIGIAYTHKAAEQGESIALNTLGKLWLTGSAPDKIAALQYFKQAMDGGCAEAAYNLAAATTDPIEQFCLYGKAYQGGYVRAAVPIASSLIKMGNIEAAKTYLQAAIDKGNAQAMSMMGSLLAETDPIAALKVLQKAKELGELSSAPGIIKSLQKTNPFLYKSIPVLKAKAQSQDAEDLYQCAMAIKAAEGNWFEKMEKAAKKDHLKACQEIAEEYWNEGDIQNFVNYSLQAADLGDAEAAYRMVTLNSGAYELHPDTILHMAKQAMDLGHPKGKEIYEATLLEKEGPLLEEQYLNTNYLPNEDHLRIARWYVKNDEFPMAQAHLSHYVNNGNKEALYLQGLVAEKLNTEHVSFFKAAADEQNGNTPYAPAALWMAKHWKEKYKATYLFCAHTYGNASDSYEYGNWLVEQGYLISARIIFWYAAQKGNAKAASKLLSPELSIQTKELYNIFSDEDFIDNIPAETWQALSDTEQKDLTKANIIKKSLKAI